MYIYTQKYVQFFLTIMMSAFKKSVMLDRVLILTYTHTHTLRHNLEEFSSLWQ